MIIENKRENEIKEWSCGDILVARWEGDTKPIYYLACDNGTIVALQSGIVHEMKSSSKGDAIIIYGQRVIVEDVFESDDVRVILGG